MHMSLDLSALAALFGVLGTLVLAGNGRWAGWGFVAYLASNVGWLVFSWEHMHQWLFAQHVAFLASSGYGIWIWLVRDRLYARFDRLFADPYDTHIMEDEIFRQFDGRNAQQLAAQYGITAGEVFDIAFARGAH